MYLDRFIEYFGIFQKSQITIAKEAKRIKNLLDLAYRLRNDIAHGERSYDPYDFITLDGKEILAQDVYWKMKNIVAFMIIKGISKLIANKDMKSLRFTEDDLITLIFKKQ